MSTINNGNDSCALQIAFITKHLDPTQQFFLKHFRGEDRVNNFFTYLETKADCVNLVKYIAPKIKNFQQGSSNEWILNGFETSFI